MYPTLMKSSIGLGFLKNFYKGNKGICSENAKEFSKLFALVLASV